MTCCTPVTGVVNLLYTCDRCRKLPKALKEWQAYEDLRKTIDDFNETCPLLELMANKSMQLRHWERISKITSHVFDIESDNFLLRNLMAAPLLKYKEDIEVSNLMVQSLPTRTAIACRAFSQAAPRVWNDLPIDIRNSVTFDRFRSALRTHYYRLAFDNGSCTS